MPRIREWTARVISRIDWAVSQIENHESQVSSALRDVQRAAARARVQLGRVQKDGRRLRAQLDEERRAVELWRGRAVELSRSAGGPPETSDPDSDGAGASEGGPSVDERTAVAERQALECLRRGRAAARNARQLEERLSEHERVEERLRLDLSRVEQRIGALREQRNLLRTRQSRAEALSSAQDALGHDDLDLDDLFDRWETRITEIEMSGDLGPTVDAFEHALLEREEESELRAELAGLLRDEREDAG